MARHPSFFLLGAVSGLVLWLIEAPTPFPFLGLSALVSGMLGFALSVAYVLSYEPWRWRALLASLDRARHAVAALGVVATAGRGRVTALRARS